MSIEDQYVHIKNECPKNSYHMTVSEPRATIRTSWSSWFYDAVICLNDVRFEHLWNHENMLEIGYLELISVNNSARSGSIIRVYFRFP